MGHPCRFACLRLVGICLAAALVREPSAWAATPPICDGASTVTVLGMDTQSGQSLFALPDSRSADTWLIELDAAGRAASAVRDRARHFGGSVGPGPILALVGCGPDCIQAETWQDRKWRSFGATLSLPEASVAAATYDGTGAPWIVALTAAPEEGQRIAAAFRFEQNRWQPHGTWTVAAVGQPQALPAPMRKDGVVAGTGLFTASGPPETWAVGLPQLAADHQGQVLPRAGQAAAYVSGDGVIYLSPDSGKSWRRSTWTPWESSGKGATWRQGTDYGVDLPFGSHDGTLQLVWFDRRDPAQERVLLTRLGADGTWEQLGTTMSDVRSKSGERLPVSQVLVPQSGRFILLSGCAATANGSGLVLRSYEAGSISAPRLVPVALTP